MKVYTGLHRGSSHKNYCEDFLLTIPISKHIFVGMVADGCSAGKHAHFASAFQCKLMRKVICKSTFIQKHVPIQLLANRLLLSWMQDLKYFKQEMLIPENELLSTFILLIYNSETKQAYISALGDGGVLINQDLYEIDQNNCPDYPIYHIEDSEEEWLEYLNEQSFLIEAPSQVGIATDGIFSFYYTQNIRETPESKFADYLMRDTGLKEYEDMIQQKIYILNTQFATQAYDDIAVIRILLEHNLEIKVF
ncbi:MAG: protein phosphatase 2C domain-containing protein [Thermoflexibacter sp.]